MFLKVQVTVASLHDDTNPVICSRNVILGIEKPISEAVQDGPFDAILLPGGLKCAQALADVTILYNKIRICLFASVHIIMYARSLKKLIFRVE